MSHIPPHFSPVTPYLHLEDADGFLQFVVEAFGGEIVMSHVEEGRLVHGEVLVLGAMMEASEARPEWPATVSAFHVYVPDVDAIHARAIQAGATELNPPADQDYGERSGALRDRWGNHWYVATVTDMTKRTQA